MDRTSVQVPEVLTGKEADAAYEAARQHFETEERGARQKLHDFEPLYKRPEVHEALLDLFARKCAFCESRISRGATTIIAHHFRPKQEAVAADGQVSRPHYWWLAYAWENLYLACPTCATAAGPRGPVAAERAPVGARGSRLDAEDLLLVDPCRDHPEKHLAFQPHGQVVPRTPKGEHTIATYGLNRRDLVQERLDAIEAARQLSPSERSDRRRPYAGAIAQVLVQAPPQALPDSREFWRSVRARWNELRERFRRQDEPPAPMRPVVIERLELRNFRSIERLDLEIAKEDAEAPWTMLLGENGRGKTSVLQAIALLLMGKQARGKLKLDADEFIRHDTESAEIVAHLRGGGRRTLTIKKGSGFEPGEDDDPLAVAAYGASRIPGRVSKGRRNGERPRVENLFDASEPLGDAKEWLGELEEEWFDFAGRALRQVLLEPEDTVVERGDKKVFLSRSTGPRELGELSDGYRSMIALATDIMSFFKTRFGSMSAAEGVVLVDEIGAHLHPSWQMRLVEALRTAFPRLQFVATTHEPLCLRGLRDGEVVVLRETSEHRIYALPPEEVPSVRGLRVDELLTSEVFGLSSTIDPKLDLAFERYYQLLASPKRGPEAEREIEQLRTVLKPHRQLGSTLTERLALEAADEYVAKARDVPDQKDREELLEETRRHLRTIWAGEER